jgi:hypothetical protein
MRMTVNAVPSTPALGQKAAIPLGCILQPMAPSDEVRGCLSIREKERRGSPRFLSAETDLGSA